MKKTFYILMIVIIICLCCAMLTACNEEGKDTYVELSFSESVDGYLVNGAHGEGNTILIPETHDGKPVYGVALRWLGDCPNLKKIVIPSTVNSVLIKHSSKNVTIEIAEGNSNFKVENNCIIRSKFGEQYLVAAFGKDVVIPEGVTRVEEIVFSSASEVESVVIPGSMEEIEKGVFKDCKNLKSVTIKEGVEIIGEYAFSLCTQLERVSIPSSVIEIGDSAFSNCAKLKEISLASNSQLKKINRYAFLNCNSLESFTIPASVDRIAYCVFAGCSSLTEVVFEDVSTWYMTKDEQFWNIGTNGKETDVSNSATNGEFFKAEEYQKNWDCWYKL